VVPFGSVSSPSRSPALTGLLLAAFLVSGATGLIYEVLWTRMLTLWFGATAHAIATVLTAFMGGLALGGWLGGWAAERWPDRPLKLYALAEVAVAVTAVGLQFLLEHAGPLMGWFALTFPGTGALALGVRFAVLSGLLLVPTVAMGATFPLFCQGLITHRISVHRGVSLAYGANVLGAALGCLVTAYWLLETLGVHSSVFVAAALNLVAAAVVGGIGRGAGSPTAPATTPEPASDEVFGVGPRLLLGLVGLSGLTAMAFEVLWSRIARQALGLVNPFLAFALVLSLVLVGMALGSFLLGLKKPAPRQALGLFGRIQVALALLAVAGLGVIRWGVADLLPFHATASHMGVTVVVMMTASVLTGMNFPLLGSVYAGREEQLGLRLGRIYAASTLGGVLGSIAGGFVLVPVFGTRWSLLLLAIAYAAAGVLVFTVALGKGRRALPALAGATAALVGVGLVTPDVPEFECPSCTIRWLDDGLEATTVVADSPQRGTLLFTDGKSIVAQDQKNRALVPMLVVPSRQTVLLIGFGTGLSASQVLENFPGTRVESAELDGNMARTAHYFGTEGLWTNPDFHLEIADGRQHMLATPGRYDLIINDTWTQAINHEVYSSGFFGVARQALTDDGTFYIRVPLEDLNRPQDLEVILRTAAESFPYAYAMVTTGLSAILGRTQPLPETPFRYDLLSPTVQRNFPFRFRRDDVKPIDETVLARLESDRVNSDDRPWFFPLQRGVDPSHGERMKRTVEALLGVSASGPGPGPPRGPGGPPRQGPPSPPPAPPR